MGFGSWRSSAFFTPPSLTTTEALSSAGTNGTIQPQRVPGEMPTGRLPNQKRFRKPHMHRQSYTRGPLEGTEEEVKNGYRGPNGTASLTMKSTYFTF